MPSVLNIFFSELFLKEFSEVARILRFFFKPFEIVFPTPPVHLYIFPFSRFPWILCKHYEPCTVKLFENFFKNLKWTSTLLYVVCVPLTREVPLPDNRICGNNKCWNWDFFLSFFIKHKLLTKVCLNKNFFRALCPF